jgi:hypothetical protein
MKLRNGLRSLFAWSIILPVAAMLHCGNAAGADSPAAAGAQSGPHFIGQSVKNDISPPLSSINPILPSTQGGMKTVPLFRKNIPVSKNYKYDPVVQNFFTLAGATSQVVAMLLPAVTTNFEGNNNAGNGIITGFSVMPPDTNGDVGLSHYVQWVNIIFSVYNKSGTRVYGPAAGNTLWSGFGGLCETENDGDIIALYDRQADRWLMSQFAYSDSGAGPFHQCIAISQTGDPTGSWYRYDFIFSNTLFNDYPKFGIWNDAYYMTANQFSGNNFAGVGTVAFERSMMLQGLAARQVYFNLHSIDISLENMLPSHLNGPNAPPAGSPNYVVKFDDTGRGAPADQLEIWAFHVDWTTPANSTFTKIATLTTATFDSIMCTNDNPNCIPHPGTTAKVDAISDRLMNRLQYRTSGSYESRVVNHTVDAGTNHAGIRWYELRKSTGGWSIQQQGTYAPDNDHRWMGSAAMDGMGNIAVGYSVSSITTFPSVRYTGRLSTDALNTLPQGEGTIIAGGGSQTDSSGRWGDYSSMSVDPADDSTFWYTQEYYSTTMAVGDNWQTRIAAFSLCPNNRAMTPGPVYTATLHAAYANASAVDTISAQSVTFRENLILNSAKAITLTGGYNCLYNANPLRTTINGSLTVSGGSVIIGNITIQ